MGLNSDLREQLHHVAAAAQALHRDLVVQACHHDLPGARLAGAMHGEQVAVEYAASRMLMPRTFSR